MFEKNAFYMRTVSLMSVKSFVQWTWNKFRIIGHSTQICREFAEFTTMSMASLCKGRQLPVAYLIF